MDEDTPRPPDGSRDEELTQAAPREAEGQPRWRVTLYAMWTAQFCAIMGFSFVMPFMPFYIRELGITDPKLVPIWAGVMVTSGGITMSLAAPVWGAVADRYGRKLMVQRAMFGGAVLLSLMGLVRNVYQLLGLRALQGAVTGTVPASVALVSSVVPKAVLGRSLGLLQMAVFTGGSVGPYLGGLMADHVGYRIPFGITGGLLLMGGMLVLFGARENFVRPAPDPADAAPSQSLLRTPGVSVLMLIYLTMNLSGSFVGAIFPLFVEQVAGQPDKAASETGLVLAVTGVTSAFASIMVGRLSDRYGHKRILILCTALAGLLSFPQAIAQNVMQLLIMRAVFGLAVGGMIPAMNAMVATTVPRDQLGRAYGLTTMASSLGWGLGPLFGGLAAAALGLRIPFLMMGSLLLLLALAAQRGVKASS